MPETSATTADQQCAVTAGDVVVIAADLVRCEAAAARPQPAIGGQAPGQQALLDGARQPQFLLHLVLGLLLLQEARIFQHGGGLDGQRLQQFAIAARHVGGDHARIHVQHADRFVAAAEHRGGFAEPGANAHQRNADRAAQFQVGDAVLRPGLRRSQRVEVHGEQFAPVFQRATNHLARNAQIGLAQIVSAPVARHLGFERGAGRAAAGSRARRR